MTRLNMPPDQTSVTIDADVACHARHWMDVEFRSRRLQPRLRLHLPRSQAGGLRVADTSTGQVREAHDVPTPNIRAAATTRSTGTTCPCYKRKSSGSANVANWGNLYLYDLAPAADEQITTATATSPRSSASTRRPAPSTFSESAEETQNCPWPATLTSKTYSIRLRRHRPKLLTTE